MPWEAKDVSKHNAAVGAHPEHSKRWAGIANGVLRQCQDARGEDCEGKAIRIANSKFEHHSPVKYVGEDSAERESAARGEEGIRGRRVESKPVAPETPSGKAEARGGQGGHSPERPPMEPEDKVRTEIGKFAQTMKRENAEMRRTRMERSRPKQPWERDDPDSPFGVRGRTNVNTARKASESDSTGRSSDPVGRAEANSGAPRGASRR